MSDFNLDTLLDGTLDDLADLPVFEAFPPGAHRAIIGWEILSGKKEIKGHKTIKLNLVGKETKELADSENFKPISENQETSVLFFMDLEMGQGAFKNVIGPLMEHFGAKSPKEAMEKSNGAEVMIVTDQRKDEKKNRTYTGIVGIAVL